MTTSVTPVTALAGLIESGAFASQTEAYLNRTFRRERMNWYADVLATDGRAAAEQQLAEWVERNHYAVFSSGIESVARGIVALAKAKDDSLVDITDCATGMHTSMSDRGGSRHKFIVFNTQAPGCGCMQPKGSYTWGPYGEIGLQAIILETGHTHNGPTSAMTLVLPAWARTGQTVGAGTVFFAKIEANGSSWGERYTLYAQTEEGQTEIDNADTCLRYLLGMTQLEGKVWMNSVGSSVDQTIGFPGAENYLATKLPELGDYFVALAEKLSTPHTH